MIAHEQQECVLAAKLRRAMNRMRITERRGLLDEREPVRVFARRSAVFRGVAGHDHHADLLDARAQDFLHDDRQRRLRGAVAIDERLQRQRALVGASGGDEGLADVHGESGEICESRMQRQSASHALLSRRAVSR